MANTTKSDHATISLADTFLVLDWKGKNVLARGS